jgi:NAD(P)-dependent dehydrogenase (short-subunit alcohol dehydrogenase family)
MDRLRVAITGGTSGLGLALVHVWIARGARVTFVARDCARVEAIAARTGAHGIAADVARKEHIHPMALQIVGLLGGVDVLINNASSLGPVPLRPLADTECEDLELALTTNLVGPFRLTRALLGSLAASAREGRGGVVLNVSSDAAVNAYPAWGAYGASKAALHHLTRIWQEELGAEGLRFLSIDPGDMDTPLHALAVPDADPTTLKRPEAAAAELVASVERALSELRCARTGREAAIPELACR